MSPRLWCIGLAMLASAGSGGAGGASFREAPPAERRFLPVTWRRTVVLEGALDSDLLRPELMVARDSTIYVYDYGDQAVKAFALDGTLRWRFGRNGRGPGEFVNPTDLQLDRKANLWLADPATSRVTVVSGAGRLVRTVQTEVSIERLLPLGAEGFLGFAFAGEKPRFDRFDSLGKARARVRHPAWLDTVPSLVSELRVAATPDGRQFAIGSFYSGRLMLLGAGDTSVRDIDAIEAHVFPRPITYSPNPRLTVRRLPPESRPTIRWLTADDQSVYALILGRHKERGRIVDLYRLRDGAYTGSWLLPEPVAAISITSRGVAALVTDPLPSLYYFERQLRR